jgi:hypothetical protein
MMGYSVTEAASVLGVPTERVWELLARGVLAGEPEGESGMRVFLQPRPAPLPVAPADEEITARTRGPERELSPFRELLTEFRSLTERYGQALLALGEARGEVASLRSRVDLLEARIDLRLPMGAPSASWPGDQPSATGSTMAPEGGADAAVAREDEDLHRPRRRGARRATESFAEALARAEDPSLADLAGPADADALSAFRSEADAAEVSAEADRTWPREAVPAAPVLVAEEADELVVGDMADPSAVRAAPTEPAEPAPGQAALADETSAFDVSEHAAEPAAADEPEPVASVSEPEVQLPEAADDWAEPSGLRPEPALEETELDADGLPASLPAPEPVPWPEFEVAHEPDAGQLTDVGEESGVSEPADDGAPEAVEPAVSDAMAAEPADFDAQRYTTAIEQPDWLEAEADEPWQAGAPGGEPSTPVEDSVEPAAAPEPMTEAAQDVGTEPVGEAEEDMAWPEPAPTESGADEMEVAGAGHGPESARPEGAIEPGPALPGSRELHESLEEFGDLGRHSQTAASEDEEWPPTGAEGWTPYSRRSSGFVAGPVRQPYSGSIPSGPATRAYRRLRRIFPT